MTVVGQEACTLSDGTSSTCLKISSSVSPDHQAGPWCNGGEWLGAVYDITQSYGSIGYDCNTEGKYSVCPSTNPTCTRCLECAVRSTSNTYYIPTAPRKAASKGSAAGDFSTANPKTEPSPLHFGNASCVPMYAADYGSAIALNGVPLAGPDPVSKLTSQKNPAPLDWCTQACSWTKF